MKRIARVSLAALLPLLLILANSTAFGQDLPPGPTTVHRSTLPGLTMAGEFELVNLILDFAPGAATPLHTHGGPGIVTVLEGAMVFGVEGQPDQLAPVGAVYPDLPGTSHTAANKSSNSARVSYLALLPKGTTLTTVTGGGQGGELPPGPTTVHRSTLPGLTMAGEFELVNLILDFAPGAATPLHTHGGPGIVTVLEGEITFGVEGRADLVAKPGAVYPDLPGTVHTAANKTSVPARVSYALALPKGATLTTVVGGTLPPAEQPAVEDGGQVGMPRTGRPPVWLPLTAALVFILLGVGFAGWSRLLNARRR